MTSVSFIQWLGVMMFAIGLPTGMAGAAIQQNKMMAFGAALAILGLSVAHTAWWAS